MEPDQGAGPERDPQAQAETRRWLLRLGVVAIGLWFVVDGLRGIWPGAGVAARILLIAAVLLGVALLVMGVRQLPRRDRG